MTTKANKPAKSLGKFSFNLRFVKILEGRLVKTTSTADGESDHQLGLDHRKPYRAYFHPPGPPEPTGPGYNAPLVGPGYIYIYISKRSKLLEFIKQQFLLSGGA